ncbi:MAG: hypothetical protein ACLTSX_08955 [Collinsella sp.]
MKTIHVAAAIILDGNKILACQRGYGEFKGGWEFPAANSNPMRLLSRPASARSKKS